MQTGHRLAVATLIAPIALLTPGCLEVPANPSGQATGGPTSSQAPHVPTPLPPTEAPAPTSARPLPRSTAPHPRRTGGLLYAARGGDGDSWKDAAGREYRLGLVNAPETGECFGAVATRTRKELVAAGFRAETYTIDRYGRRVSVVTLADGRNLNVFLARHGYADDRYLSTFRSENPALAAQLDPAFAAAKTERAGLWAACAGRSSATAQPTTPPAGSGRSCDPAYPNVCIAPPPPDLDCNEVPYHRFRVLAPDPHHFDADHDGIGCESG